MDFGRAVEQLAGRRQGFLGLFPSLLAGELLVAGEGDGAGLGDIGCQDQRIEVVRGEPAGLCGGFLCGVGHGCGLRQFLGVSHPLGDHQGGLVWAGVRPPIRSNHDMSLEPLRVRVDFLGRV